MAAKQRVKAALRQQERVTAKKIRRRLNKVDNKFLILNVARILMAKIDDVIAAVAEEKSVIASLGVLLDSLTAEVKDLREDLVNADVDTEKLDALLGAVEDNKDMLRAAVIKNTPVEGTDPVEEHGLTM